MPDAALPKYMLDTNVFDGVLDGKISITSCAFLHLLATRIQIAELRATNNTERRENLLTAFEETNSEVVLASSFAFDIEGAGLDEACWNDGSGNYEKMLDRLRELDAKRKDQRGQMRDILIAETAIKNRATLVSEDRNLRQVVSEFGGLAIDQMQFERETRVRS